MPLVITLAWKQNHNSVQKVNLLKFKVVTSLRFMISQRLCCWPSNVEFLLTSSRSSQFTKSETKKVVCHTTILDNVGTSIKKF